MDEPSQMIDPDEVYDPSQLEDEDPEPRLPISRWLVPLGVVLVVGTLVGIALGRGQTMLDPSSPEGAVQQYLLAISEERWDDALTILDPNSFGDCKAEDFTREPMQPLISASHIRTTMGSVEAYVEVSLRFGDSGPLGGGYDGFYSYSLTQRDRNWYIINDAWPASLWQCARFR